MGRLVAGRLEPAEDSALEIGVERERDLRRTHLSLDKEAPAEGRRQNRWEAPSLHWLATAAALLALIAAGAIAWRRLASDRRG